MKRAALIEAETTEEAPGQPVAPAEPAAAPPLTPEAPPAPTRSKARRVLPVLAVVLFGALSALGYWWWTTRFLVTTDDAYVGAEAATLAPKIAANVVAVPVEANQRVKAGDPVVVLDDVDFKLALAGAEAKLATQGATLSRIDEQTAAARIGVDQARAQLDAATADAVRTQADFERAQALYERTVGAKATLDRTRGDRDRAAAMVVNARGALAAAQANVKVLEAQRLEAAHVADELRVARDRARRDLDFTVIRAPIDGIVANKAVQVGDYVTPAKRLAAVVPIDQIYVDANFKETQLADIRPGAVATIRVDAFPGHDIRGTVISVAPGSGAVFSLLPPENATGNFTKIVQRVPVRIRVPAEVARTGRLRPGLSVVVTVDTASVPAGPQAAQ